MIRSQPCRSFGLDSVGVMRASRAAWSGGRHPALVDARPGDLAAVGLAGVGLLLRHVLQHGGDAAAGLRVGDAGAHHAGAQDADLVRLELRHRFGRDWPLDRVHVEEEGVDHVLRHRRHDQPFAR
jgi:hypothetical protein